MKKDISLEKFHKPFTQPKNWQDFEDMCKDLLDMEYPSLQKATINEATSQDGVDVIKILYDSKVVGMQCKKIDIDNEEDRITPAVVDEETEKAKNFNPKLNLFIIATSVNITDKTFKYIIKKSHELQKQGFFSIDFWGPKKLTDLLNEHTNVFKKYFPELLKGVSINFTCELFKDVNNPSVAIGKIETLWKESENTSSNEEKTKILTQWAVSLNAIGKYTESAEKIIQSYQYGLKNENMFSNMASAYLMLNNMDKAIEFANKVIEINPLNANANHILLIDKISKTNDIQKLIDKFDNNIIENISVAITIAQAFIDKNDFKNAVLYLEKARHNLATEKGKRQKNMFLILEFQSIKLNTVFFIKANKDLDFVKLKKIRQDLVDLWSSFEDMEEKKENISCALAIIEISLLLKEYDFYESYLKAIQNLDGNNPSVIHEISLIYFVQNNYLATIEYLESKKNFINEDSKMTLILSYSKNKKFDLAYKMIDDFISSQYDVYKKFILLINAIPVFLNNNQVDNIKKILPKIKEQSDILYYIFLYEIDKDITSLLEAKKLVEKNTNIQYIRCLANKFYEKKHYAEAKELFEFYLDNSVYSNEVCYYGICLMKEKSLEDTIKLLESFKKEDLDNEAINLLYHCYYRIGDMMSAKNILMNCYDKLNVSLKIECLKIRTLANDTNNIFDEIDKIKEENLEDDNIIKLSNICKHLGNEELAIDILYRTIQRGNTNDKIEGAYVIANLFRKYNDTTIVTENAGVILRDQYNKEVKFIIDNNPFVTASLNVYPITHLLVINSIGKRIGDKVQFKRNDFSSPEEFTIEQIFPKHILLMQVLMKDFNVRHPDTKVLFEIPIDTTNIINSFKPTRDVSLKSNEYTDKVVEGYNKGLLTIEVLSELLNKDIFSTYEIAKLNNVFCNLNTAPPKLYSQLIFEDKKDVIIDIISLLNIFELGLEEKFKNIFNSISIISYSWFSLLNGIELLSQEKSGQMFFHKDVPHPIVENRDKQKDDKQLQKLLQFKNWIDKNCRIIPAKAVLKYKESDIDNLARNFGHNISYTFMEASWNENLILYCDDGAARIACLQDRVKNITYIVPVIDYFTKNNIITLDERSEIILNCVKRNYRKLPISYRDLAYSYNKGVDSFSLLSKEISSKLTINEIATMVYRIMVELNNNFIMPKNIQEFIEILLQNFTVEQRKSYKDMLKKILQDKFYNY